MDEDGSCLMSKTPRVDEEDVALETNGDVPMDDIAPNGLEPEEQQPYRLLGARFQDLRRSRGLSQREVATAVGVSPSFLSLVERGQTDLSLSRFTRLTEFFNIPPSELIVEFGAPMADPTIRGPKDHRMISRGPGVEYVVLQDSNPQMIYARIESGGRFNDMRAHRGEDFWYVISGKADLSYGGRKITLVAGESARFSSTMPHGFLNPYGEEAVLVALCTIPYW